jgi:hypothetical protein
LKILLSKENKIIEITTKKDSADDLVVPFFKGEESIILELKNVLNKSYGYYGHRINLERTTNLDLYSACLNLEDYQLVSCEPIPKPNPKYKDMQT